MAQQWDGAALSQTELMLKDQVIVLDVDDNIIGSGSKWDTHRFVPGQPRGVLHRAFSVFLFNAEGKLLLQQRAADKITFPNVWTNTCCSHPLTGFEPTEVDQPAAVADGSVMGVKRAAVRKLDHELGIPAAEVPLSGFKFLTRLHYYAADSITHGKHRSVLHAVRSAVYSSLQTSMFLTKYAVGNALFFTSAVIMFSSTSAVLHVAPACYHARSCCSSSLLSTTCFF
jgi:isopentenyl-diphosphate delta-isomerase type 1